MWEVWHDQADLVAVAKHAQQLRDAGIRVQAMLSRERMNAKIRQAQKMQVPYMLIVGDQEVSEGTISVRERSRGQQFGISVAAFIGHVREVIDGRQANL